MVTNYFSSTVFACKRSCIWLVLSCTHIKIYQITSSKIYLVIAQTLKKNVTTIGSHYILFQNKVYYSFRSYVILKPNISTKLYRRGFTPWFILSPAASGLIDNRPGWLVEEVVKREVRDSRKQSWLWTALKRLWQLCKYLGDIDKWCFCWYVL